MLLAFEIPGFPKKAFCEFRTVLNSLVNQRALLKFNSTVATVEHKIFSGTETEVVKASVMLL